MNQSQSPKRKRNIWGDIPLGGKVVTIVIVSVVVALLALTAWSYINFSSQTQKMTGEALFEGAKTLSAQTEGILARSVSNLQALALSPTIIEAVEKGNQTNSALSDADIANLDKAWKDKAADIEKRVEGISNNAVSSHLVAFLKTFPEEIEVFVTDQRGLNIAMTDRTSDYLQGDEDWWKAAYADGKGASFIDQVELDESTGVYAVNIAVPVVNAQGALVGVLRGTVDVTAIFTELAKATFGETGHASLIDPQGIILYSQNSELFLQPAPEKLVEFLKTGESWSSNYVSPTGAKALLAVAPLPGLMAETLGWKVLMEQDLAEVNAPNTQMLIQSLLVMLACLVVISLTVFVVSNRLITNPLKALTGAAKQLASGDLEWKLGERETQMMEERGDEIGQLARSLDTTVQYMLDKVFWFENILDSIPLPLSVTDSDMNWTFINRPVENFLKVKRKDVLGHQCSEWKAGICKTEDCGIARLRKNYLTTFFNQAGGDFKVDSNYLINRKGEHVGHIEVVQDITQMISGQKYQQKAVEQLAGYLNQMASGDLGFSMQDLPPADANTAQVRQVFEHVNESLSQARDRLSATIRSVIETANQVTDASTTLAMAASQAGTATGQIATTIQQVARGASSQNEAINKMVTIVDELNRTVEGVSQGIKEQSDAVNAATQVSTTITEKNGISARVNDSAQKVQEMGQSSEQIGQIVETIEDIASQTNLLALNAAIEAARAGEHGKGFAVVADEVRKLAERSSAATKEIAGLVAQIRGSVSKAVDMSTSAARDLSRTADGLAGAIHSVAAVVETNVKATQKMGSGTSGVMESIESVASVSEENGAAIEEVSASAEEMTAQVEEVTASAQALSDMAVNLQSMVNQFRLEDESRAAAQVYASPVKGNGKVHKGY
jgi:methyl-accepting chemotaxis protein